MLKYIPYVLMFAVATMIIYGWGLWRTMHQKQDLSNMLCSKGISKVKKALKKNKSLTKKELEPFVKDLTAKQPFNSERIGGGITMATLQSLGSVAGLINLDYGKFKYAVDQMRTSADGINGNVEERARGAERSEALDEFAEQFVQLQRIISLYKSLIKKDIDAIETTGEQLKEIDLKLEGVWKGLQMLK